MNFIVAPLTRRAFDRNRIFYLVALDSLQPTKLFRKRINFNDAISDFILCELLRDNIF